MGRTFTSEFDRHIYGNIFVEKMNRFYDSVDIIENENKELLGDRILNESFSILLDRATGYGIQFNCDDIPEHIMEYVFIEFKRVVLST